MTAKSKEKHIVLLCIATVREKFLVWEKLASLVNCELFAKIFLANIHRSPKMYLVYALTLTYSPNFSLPIAFTCTVRQKVPLPIFSHVWYSVTIF